MIQPHLIAAIIRFRDWIKPWKMSEKEAVTGRVKGTFSRKDKTCMVPWRCRADGLLGEKQ